MERRDRYRRPPRRRGSYPSKNRGPRKRKQFIKKTREVIILDVLPHGHIEDDRPTWQKSPLVQVITFPDFVLYEVKTDKYNTPRVQDKDTFENFLTRNELGEVVKKIDYEDLTATSKALILPLLEKEVNNFEEFFINFFNNSTSITPRMHALKLLPGIGKKHMWEILNAREKQKFVTFQDISDRTSISNPQKLIAQRVIKELQRDVKYYLFSKTKKYEGS